MYPFQTSLIMPKSKTSDIRDIAIVGGGPSGRIAALALSRAGFSSVLVAPEANKADGRTTALWQKSIGLLETIGVWEDIKGNAASLKKMRMIDDTGRLIRAPEVLFDSIEIGEEEFGFNILNKELNSVLEHHCSACANLDMIVGAVRSISFGEKSARLVTDTGQEIQARLIVAADGRNSLVRETAGIDVRRWTYPQVAVVLNLEHRLPHQHVSTEFHTPTGPFTLVPLPGRQSSLVCVETEDGAARLMSLSREALERELERRAHSILGKFSLVSEPQSFPLSGMTARKLTAHRVALVGESAHVFPPIGAQGLNLSMRDILDLVQVLQNVTTKSQDFGRVEVLARYEDKRTADIRNRTGAVDALNRSLLTGFLPVQFARSATMYLAGRISPFRRLLMREGMAPGTALHPER